MGVYANLSPAAHASNYLNNGYIAIYVPNVNLLDLKFLTIHNHTTNL